MAKNCWDEMDCGRTPGGAKAEELGVCLAATDESVNGVNGGTNGGRVCWAVAGTLCGGEVQGEFATKMDNCIRCDFYHDVAGKQKGFVVYPHDMARANCWEMKLCGREQGGSKTGDLGVCPASTEKSLDGINNGSNAGRACWAIAGTLCGGKVQGEFAMKIANCVSCDFYEVVLNEEKDFVMYPA